MDVNSSSVAFSGPAPYAAQQDQSARQAAKQDRNEAQAASAKADAANNNDISTAPVSRTEGRDVEADARSAPEAAPVSESARSEDTRSDNDERGGVDIVV